MESEESKINFSKFPMEMWRNRLFTKIIGTSFADLDKIANIVTKDRYVSTYIIVGQGQGHLADAYFEQKEKFYTTEYNLFEMKVASYMMLDVYQSIYN